MTSSKELPANAGLPGAAQALMAVVTAYADMVKSVEQEHTKQQAIAADEAATLARIRAQEWVVLDFLERSFSERRENFAKLFTKLDEAQAANDTQLMGALLVGIVDLAKASPLAGVLDLAALQRQLDDIDHVHQI